MILQLLSAWRQCHPCTLVAPKHNLLPHMRSWCGVDFIGFSVSCCTFCLLWFFKSVWFASWSEEALNVWWTLDLFYLVVMVRERLVVSATDLSLGMVYESLLGEVVFWFDNGVWFQLFFFIFHFWQLKWSLGSCLCWFGWSRSLSSTVDQSVHAFQYEIVCC